MKGRGVSGVPSLRRRAVGQRPTTVIRQTTARGAVNGQGAGEARADGPTGGITESKISQDHAEAFRRDRFTGRGIDPGGVHPAMIRAHLRAWALSSMPGNHRRSSTAAASSPL